MTSRSLAIEQVTLTEEEVKQALWQAKYVKWNKERFKDYWQDLEKQTPKEDEQNNGTVNSRKARRVNK